MKPGLVLLFTAATSGLLASGAAISAAPSGPPIPAGWKVDETASGDLTGDGINDTAVVIRKTDPALIVMNEGMGEPQLDANPRRLLVFKRTAQGFVQIASNDRMMPPAGDEANQCLVDPLDEGGISIARQSLKVNLHYWYSCGTWSVTSRTYTFKLQGQRFRLIGFDKMEFMRNSGAGENLSVNLLTGRKGVTPFNNEESRPQPTKWGKVKPPVVYLDMISEKFCPKVDARTYLC